MASSRFPVPPQGVTICGGNWDNLPEESREEIWQMDAYLRDGGPRVHGSFPKWRVKREEERQ